MKGLVKQLSSTRRLFSDKKKKADGSNSGGGTGGSNRDNLDADADVDDRTGASSSIEPSSSGRSQQRRPSTTALPAAAPPASYLAPPKPKPLPPKPTIPPPTTLPSSVASTAAAAASATAPAAASSTTAVDDLEDPALRTYLEKKLSLPRNEILLVIRLLPDHSDEYIYLVCRRVGGPGSAALLLEGISPKLQATFTYKLQDLLFLTEDEDAASTNLVTLQFAGSRSVVVCLDAEEKNWLFYCTTRLCREFARNERVTIVTQSNLRLRTSEEVLKLKCPVLLGSKMTADVRIATPPKGNANNANANHSSFTTLNTSMFPSPDTSFDKPLFNLGKGGDGDGGSPLFAETKHALLDDIFPPPAASSSSKDHLSPPEYEAWFAEAERTNVVLAEQQTMQDLSLWESCAADDVVVGSIAAQGHGRNGDPIASMLQHLESVEARLEQSETGMTEAQERAAAALLVAYDLTKELQAINLDTHFKSKLAQHVDHILVSNPGLA